MQPWRCRIWKQPRKILLILTPYELILAALLCVAIAKRTQAIAKTLYLGRNPQMRALLASLGERDNFTSGEWQSPLLKPAVHCAPLGLSDIELRR